jgi:primase-polymerase (primpol)-like protein
MRAIDLDRIPRELRERPCWVLWRYEMRDGTLTKVPCTCQGYRASVTNPKTWSKFDAVLRAFARPGFADGIGFVFTSLDLLTGLDLDHVWQSEGAEGAPWALGIIERFGDTYMEASPSDTGLKIWCKARAPRCGRWPVEGGAIEIYDRARFFAVTGRSNGVLAITDHQGDVATLVENLDEGRRQQVRIVIPGVIPQGKRHPALVSLAGTMWKRGMCLEAIEAALLITNERQCEPPYSPKHIHKIAKGIERWDR